MYTKIFDNIDINTLTMGDAWNTYENLPGNFRNDFEVCLNDYMSLFFFLREYEGKTLEEFLKDEEHNKCYKDFMENLGKVLNMLGFIDTDKFFSSDPEYPGYEMFCLWDMEKESIMGILEKMTDIAMHWNTFEEIDDKAEWFFFYRGFYMIYKFFEINYFGAPA